MEVLNNSLTVWKRPSFDSVVKAWNPEQSCQSVSEQRPDYLLLGISSLWFAQWMLSLKILPMAVSAGLGLLSLTPFDQCCKDQTALTHMVWWSDWKVLIPQGSGNSFFAIFFFFFYSCRIEMFMLFEAAGRWCLPAFNVQALSQKAAADYWQQSWMQTFTLLKYVSPVFLELSAPWWYYSLESKERGQKVLRRGWGISH